MNQSVARGSAFWGGKSLWLIRRTRGNLRMATESSSYDLRRWERGEKRLSGLKKKLSIREKRGSWEEGHRWREGEGNSFRFEFKDKWWSKRGAKKPLKKGEEEEGRRNPSCLFKRGKMVFEGRSSLYRWKILEDKTFTRPEKEVLGKTTSIGSQSCRDRKFKNSNRPQKREQNRGEAEGKGQTII